MVRAHLIYGNSTACLFLLLAVLVATAPAFAGQQDTQASQPRTAVTVTTQSTDTVDLKVTPKFGTRPEPAEDINLQLPPQDIYQALPRFGAGIFLPADREDGDATDRRGTAPAASPPIPPDYLIGPGDQLSLRVWARDFEQLNQDLTVTPEGLIYPPEIGRLTASGQTLRQLHDALARAYSKVFAAPTVTLTVSQQRVVEIYVTGDAARPGKYVLAGAATVFTALHTAGGPSAIGTFRRLKLNRFGRPPIEIDLYAYLLPGRRANAILRQPGAPRCVPPLQSEIAIAGQVRRPARYELSDQTTIAQAIEMAGGLKPTAYGPGVILWHTADRKDWRGTAIDLSDPNNSDLHKLINDGDVLVVPSILPDADTVVKVDGAVKRPGYYPVGPEATVGSVLRAAEGMVGDAHMGHGALTRLDKQRHVELIAFNVREQYYGGPDTQIPVRAKDWIHIYLQSEVEPQQQVEVRGHVARPDTYRWSINFGVSRLLMMAGGPLPGAYMDRADLLRLTADKTYEIIPVNLRAALDGEPDADIALQRGDILTVMRQEDARPPSTAYISGYVARPGKYPRHDGMKVSDLIFAAGGLKPGAGPGIELTCGRFQGRPETAKLRLDGTPDDYTIWPDTLLTDDDTVAVMGRGGFKERVDLVYLQGRVEKPGSYIIKRDGGREEYTVHELLREAGGLLPDGNPDGIVVYRPHDLAIGESQAQDLGHILDSLNYESRQPTMEVDADSQAAALSSTVGQNLTSVLSSSGSVSVVMPPRRLSQTDLVSAIPVEGAEILATRGKSGNMELEPGDTVVVPRRINTVTILGAVPRSGAVPYVAGRNCIAYINESGGLREDAAAARMVVVHANGSAAPIRPDAAIRPGDVIVVPTKHIVRTVRTESEWQKWFKTIVSLAAAALIF